MITYAGPTRSLGIPQVYLNVSCQWDPLSESTNRVLQSTGFTTRTFERDPPTGSPIVRRGGVGRPPHVNDIANALLFARACQKRGPFKGIYQWAPTPGSFKEFHQCGLTLGFVIRIHYDDPLIGPISEIHQWVPIPGPTEGDPSIGSANGIHQRDRSGIHQQGPIAGSTEVFYQFVH